MKLLLAIPFLISVAACAPVKEKIEDRTGACPNGICDNNQTKPSACNGSPKFSVLAGTFKSEPSTDPKSFVTVRSQYTFEGTKATFIKFCEKKQTSEIENVSVTSVFTTDSDVTMIRFDEPGFDEKKSKSFTCRAELTRDVLNIKAEGNCLVLSSGNKKQYFIKK